MTEFKVGSSYLPVERLRSRSYWSSPFGYGVFRGGDGFLYVIDGDGDIRPVEFLDPSSEISFSLENE